MATEHEIERLLVRLVGNSDQFREMLSEAQEEIKEVAGVVEDAGDKVEAIEDTINSLGESALAVGSSLVGLGKALDQVSGKTTTEAIENAKQQEEATVGLISAIEASGGSVERLLPKYQKWSAEMQELTVYGNEQIEMWLRYAMTLGASGDKAKEAVKLGMAISESLEMSTRRAIRSATALQQGVLRGRILRQMPAHIQKIEDESVRAAEAMRYLSKQFNLVENRARTLTGAQKQLSETWADFIKAIGQEIAPILEVITRLLRRVAKLFGALPRPVKMLIAGFFALVASTAMLSKSMGGLLVASVVLEKAFMGLTAIKTKLTVVTTALTAAKVSLTAATKALTTALLLNPYVIAAAAIVTVTVAITRLLGKVKELDAAIGQSAKLDAKFSRAAQRRLENQIALLEKMPRVLRRARAEEHWTRANKKAEEYKKQLDSVRGEVERLSSLGQTGKDALGSVFDLKGGGLVGHGLRLLGGVQKTQIALKEQERLLAELESKYESSARAAEEFKRIMDEAAASHELKQLVTQLEKQTSELRTQIDTWNLSEEAALRYKYRTAEGTKALNEFILATRELRRLEKEREDKEAFESTLTGLDKNLQKQQDALLGVSAEYRTLLDIAEKYGWASRQAEAVQKRIDQKAVLDSATAAKEVTDELLDQVIAWGRTEREMALYELAAKRVGKGQLRIVDGLHRMRKAQADYDNYLTEAKAIAEKYLDPQEKIAEKRQRLFDMLHLEMITLDEYNKELEEVYKQASKDYTVDFDVRGVEAVEWGSAAMHDLLAEYEMGLQRPEVPDLPEPEVSPEAQAIIDAQLHKDDKHEKTIEDILNKIFNSLNDRDELMIEAANLSNKS